MKMSELILAVGDENVQFQNLLNDARSIDKTKDGTKITFYTNAIHAEELLNGGKTKNIGLVLWLPRDRVDAALAAPSQEGNEPATIERMDTWDRS
jgi:hypothetical protein